MSGKIICPKCCGNGFIYSFDYDERKEKAIAIDCDYCKNQGEIDITEDVMKDLEQMKGIN